MSLPVARSSPAAATVSETLPEAALPVARVCGGCEAGTMCSTDLHLLHSPHCHCCRMALLLSHNSRFTRQRRRQRASVWAWLSGAGREILVRRSSCGGWTWRAMRTCC